jgi:hypothetical protein
MPTFNVLFKPLIQMVNERDPVVEIPLQIADSVQYLASVRCGISAPA